MCTCFRHRVFPSEAIDTHYLDRILLGLQTQHQHKLQGTLPAPFKQVDAALQSHGYRAHEERIGRHVLMIQALGKSQARLSELALFMLNRVRPHERATTGGLAHGSISF